MFRGSMVALVTPFKNDEVDVTRLCDLVEFHVAEGTNALVVAGTTGESGTLSTEEKARVISTVVSQLRGRLPVIAGTAANATKTCIELTEHAMQAGVDAVLVMTPAYIKPTQEGLFQHYGHLAHAVPIPIILYNVPGRTACDMLPETVAKLADFSNIIGIKEASGQPNRLQDLLRLCEDRLDVYAGDDANAAEWILAGAKGVISVTANVMPNAMARLCDTALRGDTACMTQQERLMPLHQKLFVESNPIPVKRALYRMGLIEDTLRLPLTPLSAKYHQELDEVLLMLGLRLDN